MSYAAHKDTKLPAPYQLLTSIFSTLSKTTTSVPPTPLSPPLIKSATTTAASTHVGNPLAKLPPSARALLTTLHVLFPPPTLLQALDLLDRGLVTQVIEVSEPSKEDEAIRSKNAQDVDDDGNEVAARHERHQTASVSHPQAYQNPPLLTDNEPTSAVRRQSQNSIYLVRSSQMLRGKGKYGGGEDGTGNVYSVRLEAWSCSCAAFAFAAFPGGGSGDYHAWKEESEDEAAAQMEWEREDGEREIDEGTPGGLKQLKAESRPLDWEFGGLSLDATRSRDGNVPVCKHLLACVLAERWSTVLGHYLKVKEVGRDEMAGFGGEG